MISLPFKKKSSTISIDVGSSLVKVIEVDRSEKVPKIVRFGISKLLPEAIVEDEIMDRNLVVESIIECIEQAGVTGKDVVTAVSGRAVIVKKIVMDKMSEEDAAEAIFWEAEQHVPFDIDDVCLDFQILNEDIGANQMEVLLVAAKKDMVNDYAELLRDAGLKPTVIDVDSFAVQNSYEANYIASEENMDEVIGLVNIGSDVTNINIIQNNSPHFTRDISIGTNNFIEDLQKELGLDYEGAQQIIKGELGEMDEAKVKDIFRKKVADLSLGIERSIAFLKAAGDADKIDKIVLSGGGARLPFLTEILSEKHDIDFSIYNPFAQVEYEEGVFAEYEEELDAIAPLLTVGIGLALRKAGE